MRSKMNLDIDYIVVDLQYFATINWYKKCLSYKHVIFDEYEHHAKMSFRNRLVLASGNGPLRLSIPLEDGRNERQLYRDVRIANNSWQKIHWRSIVSCYNRSPWFEYYRDDLAVLFEMQQTYLFDFNMICLEWVGRHLGIKLPWRLRPLTGLPFPDGVATGEVRELKFSGGDLEWDDKQVRSVADFRNAFRPANQEDWVNGPDSVEPYGQVFKDRTGFLPGLSILDLLFCEGPAAKEWLV